MKKFIAFSKKDGLELIRTYKFFVLFMVFLAFGFLNPITAKYLPELIASFMPEGMNIQISEPTIYDAWAQFFKNVPQLGLIVMIIMCSSFVASEFSKGTLINILTKGMSRSIIVLSKFFTVCWLWTICYGVSFLVTYGYSAFFWKHATVVNLFPAVGFVWVFGIFILACVLLGCIVSKTAAGGLLMAGVCFIIAMIMMMFPSIAEWSPAMLISNNLGIMNETVLIQNYVSATFASCCIIVLFLYISIYLLKRKQL